MITEDDFYNILLKEKERGNIKIVTEKIEVIPNYKLKDSPDFVLKIKLKMSIFSRNLGIEVPIPIELEKVGMKEALKDLRKFIEREKFELILPMLIVSEKKILSREEEGKLKTRLKLKQIPEREVKWHIH
ncbi:MAG: hypothetical protein KAT65_23260 [Methanophagales archaeon]|nr:hypothetical protein [Methanophagales archaeon]